MTDMTRLNPTNPTTAHLGQPARLPHTDADHPSAVDDLGWTGRSADVRLRGVAKRFGATDVLHGLDLHVPNHELAVIVGPSGCGKTTCLRLIAGLESADAGTIHIGDDDVTRRPARERDVAMVFQGFALYPHLSAGENIAFGLRLQAKHDRRSRLTRHAIRQRVIDVATSLQLDELLDRKPWQLSGGQRQRVALGRAIVREPRLFLMDEPLSNLDAQLRASTRSELVGLQRRLGVTTVYVTHDQVEALTMAGLLVVMRDGRIQQLGRPEEVYQAPANTFVATFIGTPPMNLVTCRRQPTTETAVYRSAGGAAAAQLPQTGVDELTLGWRPGHARLQPPGEPSDGGRAGLSVTGVVELAELLGDDVLVTVAGADGPHTVLHPATGPRPAAGDAVIVWTPADQLHRFDGSGSRIAD